MRTIWPRKRDAGVRRPIIEDKDTEGGKIMSLREVRNNTELEEISMEEIGRRSRL